MTQFSFEGIGTKWQVDIYNELGVEEEKKIFSLIENRIEIFDKNYSRFRDDSLVIKMSKESWNHLLYRKMRKKCWGFTMIYTNARTVSSHQWWAIYCLMRVMMQNILYRKKDLHKVPDWEEIIYYQHPVIQIKKPAILDFGAGGKGYLVDLVGKYWKKIVFLNIVLMQEEIFSIKVKHLFVSG